MSQLTQRRFVQAMTAAGLASGSATQKPPAITSRQAVSRVHAQLKFEGVKIAGPQDATEDTFKLGDPDRPITGIATTWMDTLEVLRRAHAAGCSMVITHEPTFYNAADLTDSLQNDAVYRAKMDYALERNMCVWRFHDYIHSRHPDPIFKAFNDKIGFGQNGQTIYSIEPTRLEDLVSRLERRLETPNLRFVGNPKMTVSHLGIGKHFLGSIADDEEADVWLWPEPKEFNTFEYFRDATELGIPKTMIGMTHELLEEWGMLEPCAQWLRRLIPEVPIVPLRTAEFYWTEP
jgi:putative NIF3 family GTP cyclohydrolase 1 type 2